MFKWWLCLWLIIVRVIADDVSLKSCLRNSGVQFKWHDERGFRESITVFDNIWISHPSVVVRAMSAMDVSKAVLCAAQDNRVVTARSGGHSYGGFSHGMNNGVVVDLRDINHLSIDIFNEVVDFGPGVRLGKLLTQLDRAGRYVVPAGTCPSVGVTGLTLGGGQGPLAPFYGMMSDNVLSMEVVLADGSITTIGPYNLPDLFRAMRGAGAGNFAIVTSMKMRIYKVTQLSWKYFEARETPGDVLGCVADWAKVVSPRFGMIVDLGGSRTAGFITYLGSHREMTYELQPLENCIPSSRSSPVIESRSYFDAFAFYMKHKFSRQFPTKQHIDVSSHYEERSLWARSFSIMGDTDFKTMKEIIDRYAGQMPSSGGLSIELMGGNINSVSPSATAFAHRNVTLHVAIFVVGGSVPPPADEHWGEEAARELHAAMGNNAYYNMLDVKSREHAGTKLFGANLGVLKQTAAKYDPLKRFDFPSSIIRLKP
eukprot:Blabericola_migrator_1__6309@NODE_3185_length_1967_cov_4_356842_g1992_i0_p1_GENE_NODE_3185_length_1967_cov_4_356842_g1992_i0NODE_3185_length_1967_cov_4_356842_g1992_i0_p1_ORF_typecomplete_len483_score42_42FAD_binding_4/PF01565_23/1_2e34BBE/PF08031_12/7_5e05_NODE_3185_length_1967_cov_4_356842_g1992_i01051553